MSCKESRTRTTREPRRWSYASDAMSSCSTFGNNLMQYEHLTQAGRFTVIDTGNATETLSDGTSGITSEELARLERRAAVAVLSEVHEVEGSELKFARKALGVSQPALARLLGVTPETVCRWEASKEPFKRQTQLAVLRLLEEVERNGESTLAKAPEPTTPIFTLRARTL